MVFKEEEKANFIRAFYDKQPHIRAFDGCLDVILLEDQRDQLALSTYSLWESNKALENYRKSDLFVTTWAEVKPMFAEKAQAWSYIKHTE